MPKITIFDVTTELSYYDEDGNWYGCLKTCFADIPTLEKGAVIHCYIYYNNQLMREGDITLGKDTSFDYKYSSIDFGIDFGLILNGTNKVQFEPNLDESFANEDIIPKEKWRFVGELVESKDDSFKKTFLEYLKTTPHNRWNFVILKQLAEEEEIDFSEELVSYLKETPWNTNLTICKQILETKGDIR